MMSKEIASEFLGKYVKVVRVDNNRDFCCSGILKRVTEDSILLVNDSEMEAISLDSIKNIREAGGEL